VVLQPPLGPTNRQQTHTPGSILWTIDQPVEETATYTTFNNTIDEHPSRLGIPPPHSLRTVQFRNTDHLHRNLSANLFIIGYIIFVLHNLRFCRSQWPRGPSRVSAAARLLRLWVRIPPEARISLLCVLCVVR
jgi:hypothetical protein